MQFDAAASGIVIICDNKNYYLMSGKEKCLLIFYYSSASANCLSINVPAHSILCMYSLLGTKRKET